MRSVVFLPLIFLFFTVFIPFANADSFLSPVNEKYTIVKEVGWAPWWDNTIKPAEVTIVDSRNGTQYQEGIKTLDVIVPDFVATSKGKASRADDVLSSEMIRITSSGGTITERPDGSKTLNLSGNLTEFKINISTDEKDTVTYSGKIFLKNESVLIPIPVDVVVRADTAELIVANSIGIVSGIAIAVLLGKVIWTSRLTLTTNKPWVSTALITALAIPSSVYVNTVFIGNNALDIVIAFGVGVIVFTKLIAPKDKPKEKKDTISLEFNAKEATGEKKELLDKILAKIAEFRKL